MSGGDESDALLARVSPGDNDAPVTVSEISSLLKRTVEDRFGHVRLRGELSGVKRAASGHLYCALKDDKAVIDAVMWRGNTGRLGFMPEDGIEVVATGKLTTYPGRSKYQIVVDSMEIAGEGALLALLERVKAKLEAEGLFAASRKRALPFLPDVIGVVTSPTGAVIRDILHRLSDRFPSRVVVWPVIVQGKGSAEQVAAAVRGFSALPQGGPVPRPDVVIVARGGGSIEDLWGFNEEIVVRAIAECSIPVISAVGHETDTTLADFAADLRAPTPTAAAELAVPVRSELRMALDEYGLRKRRGVARPVALARERLAAWGERLPDPAAMMAERGQKLDDLGERLRRGLAMRADRAGSTLAELRGRLRPTMLNERIARQGAVLSDLRGQMTRALSATVRHERRALDRVPAIPRIVTRGLTQERERMAALRSVLTQLDPLAPLSRGYAMVLADGQAISRRDDAAGKPALTLRFGDGTLDVAPVTQAPPKRETPAPRRRPPRKTPEKRDEPEQQSLF
ncbi:exodeoxyribonuclease VII large subunit [Croceicoccus sp. YJ47]|nr:exodeoxyribonuclease VII large subunit [Croceicoccus sp. YJ47]QQN75628.1 exodeoxyribonuclease VII large subunit [Croceicoccus sp. YJ47]